MTCYSIASRMSSSDQGIIVTPPSSSQVKRTCSPGSMPDFSTTAGGIVTATELPLSRTFRVWDKSTVSSMPRISDGSVEDISVVRRAK